MDAGYWLDWAQLLLRWAHLTTAIAWIGASFYFVMLDNSLSAPDDPLLRQRGVDGELWSVHGGGFYHAQKYRLAPRWRPLPERLHWSYWESYSTWLTGFFLFALMYLWRADSFLVDVRQPLWQPATAGALALGFLVVFWLAYDGICRRWGQRPRGDLGVGLATLALVALACWLACRWFPGRAAFLIVGAALATAMSANVAHHIIPGQRKVVAALREGRTPEAVHGQRGKQRSVHNTYFTLPVLLAMISNHVGWLTDGPGNGARLFALMLAGALIRHSFVARHAARLHGRRTPWWAAALGCALLLGVALWHAPSPTPATRQALFNAADAAVTAGPAAPAVPGFAAVQAVVQQRCVACHNAQLQHKGVALHTPALLLQHANAVGQQVVTLRQMPLNNATAITEAERALIGRWLAAGAPGP